MIIKVPPAQIPLVWDTIKLAIILSAEVDPPAIPHLCQGVLVELLNDTMQCFVVLDEQRIITQVIVTQLLNNPLTAARELWLIGLYSFKLINETLAQEVWGYLKTAAINLKCDLVTGHSRNPRLWELYKALGLKEISHQYTYKLEVTNGG